ncbi:MAG: family 16 glycoside hydrolase [Kiritimatiellia bacterium]|jgi:hypothetical protein
MSTDSKSHTDGFRPRFLKVYEYRDTFAACCERGQPDGWVVDRLTARAHQHGRVEDGAYHILCRGNRHRPLTPPLKDFELTFECRGDEGAPNAGIYVFFRYDPASRDAYYIKRLWGAVGGETHLGVCGPEADRLLSVQKDSRQEGIPPVHLWSELRVVVQGNTVTVCQNGIEVAVFNVPGLRRARPGSVAFDRDKPCEGGVGARGSFFIRKVCLRAKRVAAPTPLWKCFSVEFPSEHNGIVSPICYHLEAVAYPSHCEITVRLTGGPAARHDPLLLPNPSSRGRRWQNEHLTNPYLRLEQPGGGAIGIYYLFRGVVGLKTNWDRNAPGMRPADVDYPVERIIRLPVLPADANVFVGYEYYEAEERQWMKGGPAEAWVDPGQGRMLASGARWPENGLELEIESAPDKAIVRRIPASEPRRAQALAFARGNHYFLERERIRFWIRIRHRLSEAVAGALTADWILEDVFRQPLTQPQPCQLRGCADAEARRWRQRLGVQTLISGVVCPGRLDVGVYHLVARVCCNGRVLAEVRRAFEVLSLNPAVPAPPQASGLPELCFYESSDFHSAADVFDPWTGRNVDEGHYVSHSGFPMTFAGPHRAWDLVRLYRRKWWCWLISNVEPETLREVACQADLLYSAKLLKRFDLWHPSAYRKLPTPPDEPGVIEALLAFLEQPDSPARGDARLDVEAIRREGRLSDDGFEALTERYWKSWLEFVNRWYAQVYMPYTYARMRALNPTCEWGEFGPYPPYGSVYKSAWFPHLMGRDLRSGWTQLINGPMRFESYPIVCGYPIQRDVFQLAAMKMEAPSMRLYPEIYGVTGIPGDLHVVLGSPPYAQSNPPPACYRKRFFEYAYAAAWFDGAGFHFWNDNGFQPKHWGREEFSEFLAAWSVIRRVRPRRLLRTAGFVYSREACRRQPDIVERYASRYYQDGKGPVFRCDIINTAEEGVAFAYEQARMDGQAAGFLTDWEHLDRLSARDCHTLVLPPLTELTPDERRMIQRLHAQGINLLALERVDGLESLFGVAPLTRPPILRALRVNAAAARHAPWSELRDVAEAIPHDLCRAAYRCQGARTIIEGLDTRGRPSAPILTMHRTRSGYTALFTIAPTLVRREEGDAVITYGKASLSRLINRAMALILREIGRPEVETTAGKLIAFRDTEGLARIIIAEDRHPDEGGGIQPEINIRLPRIKPDKIQCDREFEIISAQKDCVRLCLCLDRDDCAMISVDDRSSLGNR